METVAVDQEPFLTFGKPDITEAEEKAVLDVLRSGWLGNGPVARQLEMEFAEYFAVRVGHPVFAVAVSSCTIGLVMALKACGVQKWDEVITSPLTFAATANAILQAGAKPVFADVDDSGCLDPYAFRQAITGHTKAVIPVHLAGSPCQMSTILKIAKDHNLKVIEDAAHAFGGNYESDLNGTVVRPLGTFGDFGVFSFYPTKNLASGDGGMVITKDQAKAELIRILASQGLTAGAWMRYGSKAIQSYEVAQPGYKGLMSDLHAAVALTQLRRWSVMRQRRGQVWRIYEKAFGKKGRGHSQHLYTIRIPERERLRAALHSQGIGTGVHYNPLHLEPAYGRHYSWGSFPNAEAIGAQTLSLPVSSTMTEVDAERVVKVVKGETNGI